MHIGQPFFVPHIPHMHRCPFLGPERRFRLTGSPLIQTVHAYNENNCFICQSAEDPFPFPPSNDPGSAIPRACTKSIPVARHSDRLASQHVDSIPKKKVALLFPHDSQTLRNLKNILTFSGKLLSSVALLGSGSFFSSSAPKFRTMT